MINIKLIEFIVVIFFVSSIQKPKPKEMSSIAKSKSIETKNIPDSLYHNASNASIDDILNELATKKYHKCKANVLYSPKRSLFYFNNPSTQTPNRLASYIPLKCTMFYSYVSWSKTQKFYFPFKDIEQIVNNNEDSILENAIREITNLQLGIEVSFFPVKFYKKSEINIKNEKMFLCYDYIKVLGFDDSNKLYFLLTVEDYFDIIHCDSQKTILGNLIRYSTYCDDLCNENYIYYSNDLIKCKCDFSNVKHSHPNSNTHSPIDGPLLSHINANINPHQFVPDKPINSPLTIAKPKPNEVKISSLIEKYSLFSNQNVIDEKRIQFEKNDVSYLRFYFHLFSMIVSFQIVYVFFIKDKANFFLKFNVVFFVLIIIVLYIAFCIKSWRLRMCFLLFKQMGEAIGDIYPLIALLYLSFLSNRRFSDNEFNPYWSIMILTIVMTLNSLDYVLKDIYVNEIDLIFNGIILVMLMVIKNTEPYIYIFCLIFRMKMLLEFIAKLSLFSIEKGHMLNVSVPVYIMFGKSKESFLASSKLLFQANYIKLFPYLNTLNGNWFMEALNFSRKNDIVILMQYSRYFVLVYLAHCVILFDCGIANFVSAIVHLNFMMIVRWNIQIAFKLPLLTKKRISMLFFIYMISGVLCTSDCMWIYFVHCFVGLLYRWLFEEKELRIVNNNGAKDSKVKRVFTSRNFRILSRINLMNDLDLVNENNHDVHSD